MKQTTPVQIVRNFHRWSGILLIFLVGIKILTGFNAAGNISLLSVSLAYQLHYAVLIDVSLLFFFISHAVYGLFKMVSGKSANKIKLFWLMTAAIFVLFIFAVVFIYWL